MGPCYWENIEASKLSRLVPAALAMGNKASVGKPHYTRKTRSGFSCTKATSIKSHREGGAGKGRSWKRTAAAATAYRCYMVVVAASEVIVDTTWKETNKMQLYVLWWCVSMSSLSSWIERFNYMYHLQQQHHHRSCLAIYICFSLHFFYILPFFSNVVLSRNSSKRTTPISTWCGST